MRTKTSHFMAIIFKPVYLPDMIKTNPRHILKQGLAARGIPHTFKHPPPSDSGLWFGLPGVQFTQFSFLLKFRQSLQLCVRVYVRVE